MTKSEVLAHPEGSAERVLAHARYQKTRGRRPSMHFSLERNPHTALKVAQSVINGAKHGELKSTLGAMVAKVRSYSQMTDLEFKAAVRNIITSSSSEEEVQRRVREELNYPYTIALHTSVPNDATGREARELVRGLGGMVMKNGAMVMAMAHGHRGNTISL